MSNVVKNIARRKTGEEWFKVEEKEYAKILSTFRPTPTNSVSIIKKAFSGTPQPLHILDFYKKEAKNKSPGASAEAYYNIGVIYQIGCNTKQNYAEASYWYKKAIDEGHVKACEKVARLYYKGLGVKKSYKEARVYYQKAAKRGDKESMFRLGLFYNDGLGLEKDYQEALIHYQSAADSGHVIALYNIGVMYENGQGVPQNYETAFNFYKRSAMNGDIDAQLKVGLFYTKGLGTTQNYNEAFSWYEKVSESSLNNMDVHFQLGELYRNGHGTEENLKLAFEHYSKAVQLDQTDGKSDQGKKQVALGKMYFYGLGTNKDHGMAMLMFQKALIISRNTEAQGYISKMQGKKSPFPFFHEWRNTIPSPSSSSSISEINGDDTRTINSFSSFKISEDESSEITRASSTKSS
ncbi:hypothetical protein MFLAVUS_001738 [Mucor flavus]|uniref:HCP-like protein n=1 Tax=Mucor flavus TaxID=439312 RepID=A0ABP9YNB6_9FUNG